MVNKKITIPFVCLCALCASSWVAEGVRKSPLPASCSTASTQNNPPATLPSDFSL
jgi:hypothetical protein